MRSTPRIAALAAMLAAFNAPLAHAAYCDSTFSSTGLTVLEGASVCFVYDPDAIDPKFGTLSASGDNIFATPSNFNAASSDGGTVITDGTGTIQVIAKSGFVLDAINVGENGSYSMTGAGSSVDIDGLLDVFDWNSPVFGVRENTTLTVNGALDQRDGNLHAWQAVGGFDLTASIWDGIDHVGLSLTNLLTASTSAAGESAFINKTLTGTEIEISVDTSAVVPLPAAVWLFGSGLLGLAAFARRRAG